MDARPVARGYLPLQAGFKHSLYMSNPCVWCVALLGAGRLGLPGVYQLSTANSRLIPFNLPLESWEGLPPPLLYTKLTCYPVSLSWPPPSDPDLHGTHLQVFCCLTYDLCPLESPSTLLNEFSHDPPNCSPGLAGSPSPLFLLHRVDPIPVTP